MTAIEIKRALRETRAEMRARGIKRTSCFNGGLSNEAYRLNVRMFHLKTLLRKINVTEKNSTNP